jgi:hypothetical protein
VLGVVCASAVILKQETFVNPAQGVSSGGGGQPWGPTTSSVPKSQTTDRLTTKEASYERALECARIEELGRQLRTVQAAAAILKSKLKAATGREEFLMIELRRMAAELLCKRLPSPRVQVIYLLASKLQFPSLAGMQGDMRVESERVTTQLNNLVDQALTEASNFWRDRTRAYAMVVLQD